MFTEKISDQFFADLAKAVRRRSLTELQKESVRTILQACDTFGIERRRHVAYILATAWHESRFTPIEEIRAKPNTKVWKLQERYWHTGYYGRGFVQLTWLDNYRLFSRLTGKDLVNNPSDALLPDIAAKILVVGMRDGLFRSGHTLERYINGDKTDYLNARNIVNAGLFHAERFEATAKKIIKIV